MPRKKTVPEEQGGNRVGPGNPPKSTRFRPGKSGNPGGRPKGRSITAVVRELLDEALAGDKDTRPAVERVVDALLRRAAAGDLDALAVLLDRTEGVLGKAAEDRATAHASVCIYLPHNDRDELPT